MIFVALAEAAAIVVGALVFAGLFRSLHREAARERGLMLNQILHLSGRTWMPPPVDTWKPPEEPDDFGRYVTSPSQEPDEEY